MMCGNTDVSKKLAPLLRQAFRQGVEAATRGEEQNPPYVPDSHLYHAWVAGWAALARGWEDADDLRLSRDPDLPSRPQPRAEPVALPALGIGAESD